MEQKRCSWCNLKNPAYVDYHDHHWGNPVKDDRVLLEYLILESFQAGLSWEIILNKRSGFREAFARYDASAICGFDQMRIEALMQDASIVRNRRKLEAAVSNTRAFCRIQEEWGSFEAYIWHFTEGKTVYETGKTRSELSDRVSKDLKRRGMTFLGSTTVYSYLQAVGIINSHEEGCFLHKQC